MPMMVESQHLEGVVVLVPPSFDDERGFFLEAYRKDHCEALGLPGDYVQDNHSRSVKGVIRGLHFQWDPPMAKLMRVTLGAAFVVAVDIRKGSPTLGKWVGVELTAANRRQVYAPAGFARGFCALTDVAEVQYKCTAIYNPAGESGILWNDPEIGISWPVDTPVLSRKDREAQRLSEWLRRPESETFRYPAAGHSMAAARSKP